MKRRRLVALAAVVAATLVAALLWRDDVPAAAAPAAAPPAAGVRSVASVPADAALSTAPRVPTAAPHDSLRGTDVDGAVRLDANGMPIADRELRRLFDYFLARTGERAPERIRADLVAWLAHASGVPASAQARVLELFDAYVDAEHAVAALAPGTGLPDDLARRSALRRERLGADVADAWFGDEARYADHTLRRLDAERDGGLDATQRRARLDALAQELDPTQRAALHESTDFQLSAVQSAQLDAHGAGAAQRHSERAALWGDDAATRLAQLDADKAQWQQRLDTFARERAAISEDASLTLVARDARIRALIAARFADDAERRRVLALIDTGAL